MNKMIVSLNIYNINQFYDVLKKNNICIYNIKKSEEELIFECSFYTFLKLKKHYKYIKIIKNVISSRKYLNLKKTLISILCFFMIIPLFVIAENKIFYININGVSNSLNNQIKEELKEYNIIPLRNKPSIDNLDKISKEIHSKYLDKISVISITLKGVYVEINYQKRKEPIYIEEIKGKIYSKKDAVIKDYDIIHGNLMVKRNQFVKKGDLLVDDEIILNDETKKTIGTKGLIFGYVYYKYSIDNTNDIDDFTDYIFLLKKEIMKDYLIGEYIENENVIVKDDKIHFFFTCVEILNSY